MTDTLEDGYSPEITQEDLPNEYQYDRVEMLSKNQFVLVLWIKVASVMEGLRFLTKTQS